MAVMVTQIILYINIISYFNIFPRASSSRGKSMARSVGEHLRVLDAWE